MTDTYSPSTDGLAVTLSDGVLEIVLNRPDRGNAITADMGRALTQIFREARTDAGVRCVLILPEGANLSSGADVASFVQCLELTPDQRRDMFRARLEKAAELVEAMLDLDCPVVVLHRGAAAGAGLLLSLAADEVVADDTACFLFSHQRFALPPDGGVSFLLPRIVGWREARRLVLGAARVTADEAVKLGLLGSLHLSENLEAQARKLALRYARAPQFALRAAKRLFNGPLLAELSDQLRAETAALSEAVATDDFAEGVTAFVEKRRADFPSTR